MLTRLLLPTVMLLTLASCDRCKNPDFDPTPPPDPIDTTQTPENPSKLKIIWQVPVRPDTSYWGSMSPKITGEWVWFSRIDFVGNKEDLVAINRQSGARVCDWTPPVNSTVMARPSGSGTFEDRLVVNYNNETYGFKDGVCTDQWASIVPLIGNGGFRINLIGDHVYHMHTQPSHRDTANYLVRTHVSATNWDTIFSLSLKNGYHPTIELPVSWVNAAGDTILFFQNRQFNFSKLDGQVDLWAINLRTKKMVWMVEDWDISGNSSVTPPIVAGNRLYISGAYTLHCFDTESGQKMWQRDFPNDNLFSTNLLWAEQKVFVRPSTSGNLYALDAQTGAIIYQVPDTGTSDINMVYHKGMIYFTNSTRPFLYVVRASDGALVLKEYSPNYFNPGKANRNANLRWDVTVDPQLNRLYCSDGYFYMAIELPQ